MEMEKSTKTQIERESYEAELRCESIVVEKEGKLTALIYPDFEAINADNKNSDEAIAAIMEENRKQINETLPAYSQIAKVTIYNEEFEKTPKKSIKRFLYQ